MINCVKTCLPAATLFLCTQAAGVSFLDIQNTKIDSKEHIIFSFIDNSRYAFLRLDSQSQCPNIRQIKMIQSQGLPLGFSAHNLAPNFHSGTLKDAQSLQLIRNFLKKEKAKFIKKNNTSSYTPIFTIHSDREPLLPPVIAKCMGIPICILSPFKADRSLLKTQSDYFVRITRKNMLAHATTSVQGLPVSKNKIIIAIDAGHGGKDPGAIGPNGTHEKNVTIATAKKLQTLLNNDPLFKTVMIRNGDYFLSVMGRSEVARKQKANFLVSIHADAALNPNVTGASVWVLSNRRANNEITHWLEWHEKQSALLGKTGATLANKRTDLYLNQAVLDLQFSYSQRVGYEVASNVLSGLKNIVSLHKRYPVHASLGVLRSPDIPSILVEIGFISNNTEERLLSKDSYQEKIADVIYQGLRNYFTTHPIQSSTTKSRWLNTRAILSNK